MSSRWRRSAAAWGASAQSAGRPCAGCGAAIEAAALWICIDLDGGQPLRLPEDFVGAYAESAAGRRATVRLRHPEPPEDAREAAWTWRASDLDLAGHVNNSHYWSPLEERLAGTEPGAIDAEIEHRSAAQPGPARILSSGADLWVTGADGEVQASLLSGA